MIAAVLLTLAWLGAIALLSERNREALGIRRVPRRRMRRAWLAAALLGAALSLHEAIRALGTGFGFLGWSLSLAPAAWFVAVLLGLAEMAVRRRDEQERD